jgi:hypothetical protein
MARKCNQSTVAQIPSLRFNGAHPAWLRTAVHDALAGRPMSLERERRMCAALGIEEPKRRTYWRPCLSKELQAVLRGATAAEIEHALWRWARERRS